MEREEREKRKEGEEREKEREEERRSKGEEEMGKRGMRGTRTPGVVNTWLQSSSVYDLHTHEDSLCLQLTHCTL